MGSSRLVQVSPTSLVNPDGFRSTRRSGAFWPRARLLALCLTAGALVSAPVRAAAAGTSGADAGLGSGSAERPATTSPTTEYYLALGDSLALGYDAPTGQGYTDDLFAHYGALIPNLQEVNLGCDGETAGDFLSGNPSCSYSPTTELAMAEAFLSSHPNQVAFVTINVGSGFPLGCFSPGTFTLISSTCISSAPTQTTTYLSTILTGLRSAAGPSVPIVGMTVPDPFVVLWLNSSVPTAGVSGPQFAQESVSWYEMLNYELAATYASFGDPVADAATAFSSYDLTDLVSSPYGTVPKAVAVACAWLHGTCPLSSWTVDEVHPNATGYQEIADTFEAVLGTLPRPTQIYGTDAIGTSIAVSETEFPSAGSANAVVLARSDFFADALAGGPLAAKFGGPLLITPGADQSSSIDPRVLAEIQRVLPVGKTVYILGGDLALSPSIDTTLQGLGYVTQRIAGSDEYGTAVNIAQALGNPTTIFEATGLSFQDALSAVPAAIETGGAILLTDGPVEPLATGLYLLSHPGDTRYAIGGPLAAAGADPEATAVYGQDIFGTSAAVATQFFPGAAIYGAATAVDFPDALAGGVFMATGGRTGPLLLVSPSAPLPASISSYLGTLAAGTMGDVFGGPLAVGPDVLEALAAAVG